MEAQDAAAAAGKDGPTQPEWSVPLYERDESEEYAAQNNRWKQPDHTQWSIRSADYLTNSAKPKQVTASPAFELVGVQVLSSDFPIQHAAESTRSLRHFLAEDAASEDPSFFFVCAWMIPGPPFHFMVQLFRRAVKPGDDPPFDTAWERFVAGDDAYRNSRLKQIALFQEAPWMVKATMSNLGGLRPCIIGNKLTTQHFTGHNYVEVNMDVSSSKVASMLKGVILKSAAGMVIDCAWLIEGQEEDELPERLVGASRWTHCDMNKVGTWLDEDGNEIKEDR